MFGQKKLLATVKYYTYLILYIYMQCILEILNIIENISSLK